MTLIPLPSMSEFLLDDFMIPMGLTAQEVSEGSGISMSELQDLLLDKQEITLEQSKKLGAFLGISGEVFYNIQAELKRRAEAITGYSQSYTKAVGAGI